MARKRITSADIADTVVSAVLKIVEDGNSNWRKPWATLGMRPHNPVTGTTYSGVNHLWLTLHEGVMATGDARFVTFNGANELAAKALGVDKDAYKAGVKDGTFEPAVIKGSTSTPVFFAKRIKVDDPDAEDDDGDGKKWIFMWRTFAVFHLATQVNPAYVPVLEIEPMAGAEAVDVLDALITELGATVTHDGGDRAYYRPSTHSIHLPPLERFASTSGYVATALHELGHWTKGDGVERTSAFGSVGGGSFGSAGYAREEVRVEIASAMVMTAMHVGGECEHTHDGDNTGAYVASWLRALKDNPKEILEAARDAQRIADHLLEALAASETTPVLVAA